MDFSSALQPPYIYEKCSGMKKYGAVTILEVDNITDD